MQYFCGFNEAQAILKTGEPVTSVHKQMQYNTDCQNMLILDYAISSLAKSYLNMYN